MLYHIDNTPELQSDRFWTTGWYDKRYEQYWTVDPVDIADRELVNYWFRLWIMKCYKDFIKLFPRWQDEIRYHPIRSYWTIMTELMCRIWVMEDTINLQKEKDIRQEVGKWFWLWIFLGIVLWFICASVVFLFVLK
jgi:hypothetical protein